MRLALRWIWGCLLMAAAGCSPHAGDRAPDFELPLLNDSGTRVRLSEVSADHVTLLVFWATWCPSCAEEIPVLNGWQEQYGPRGLKIYGLNVGESRDAVLDFQKEIPIRFPVLLDEDSSVSESYNVSGIPTAVVLAKGGEIRYYGFSLPRDMEYFLAG